MKYILIKMIRIYQSVPGSFHNSCRHIPTCSNYGIEAIQTHGSIKGSIMTAKRILKCNPLGTSGYDPVPQRREKMKKNIKLLLICLLLLPLTGCFKRDSMEQIDIYTTVYPIEYVTNILYGESSNVYSIYPDGIDVNTYELTDKQIKDYSKSSLFIFNGLSSEKNYVVDFFKENKNIKIIDTTLNMEYNNKIEELWLNPSNLLMLAQNIKNGLDEYINNHYLKNKIQANYDKLKIDVSNIDAKLKLTAESASSKTLVVSNDLFKFLEKYDLNIISLENNPNLTEKVIADTTALIKSGEISYIYVPQNEELNETILKLQEETDVEIVYFHTLSSISETERNDKTTYLDIMNNNIELLKKEIYE